jgi:predicted RNA-binding protein with PUA-like domain
MWLVKTEPGTYSYGDLEKQGRTVWDGVSNPVALRNLRAMKVGDPVVVYHTGDEKAAVGIAEVTKEFYRDPKGRYPALVVVDLKAIARLSRPVTLAEMKASPLFKDSPIARQGRLSVVPLTAAQWKFIEGGGKA